MKISKYVSKCGGLQRLHSEDKDAINRLQHMAVKAFVKLESSHSKSNRFP